MTARPPEDEDLIDTGPPDRRTRVTSTWRRWIVGGAVLVLIVAVVSFGVRYRDGDRRAPTPASPPPTPSAGTLTPARLAIDGSSSCGTLVDDVLSVAFAVLNTGGRSLTIDDVRPVLPLGGLQPLGGTADRPPAGAGCPDSVLRPGDTLPPNSGGWIPLSFQAAATCLAPLPIEVDVVYVSDGRTVTSRLMPFPDLGAVDAAARGCPTVAAT